MTNNTERTSVENVDNAVVNSNFINTIFVADPHNTGIEIRKQYDIPIMYSGDSTLNGILYTDEDIDNTLYPNGISVDIDILTQ